MAIHEIQFPPSISYGASGGPGFKTSILTLASGYERRNINWSVARGQWDVAHGIKTQEQLNVLIQFFYARRGKAYGFRFKDWTDYTLPSSGDAYPTFLTTNGVTSTFQLTKVYSSGGTTYTRTITKPVLNTTVVFDNGSPVTQGAGGSQFTVSTTTGVVTLGATLAATSGHVITAGCQFDVPARFDVDELKATIDEYNSFTWGQINIVELRE